MKICVVGTGYVGLVTGAGFADVGNSVVCVDIDAKKIENLQAGIIPIFEPGLEELVRHNEEKGRLKFSTDLAEAVTASAICFIAVGTPPNGDGSTDLRYVDAAARDIGRAIAYAEPASPKLIGIKSTVPVGTCERVDETIKSLTDRPFAVFSNPEFLKEGDAVNDFMMPDRIIVGTDDERVRQILRELYQPFNRKQERILFMSPKSAELTKYAANAMLATRISFMNELANLAEKVGANIEDIRVGIGSDPRIGNAFLYPGIGYGGSCFPKDVKSLIHTARAHAVPLRVVEAVEAANDRQKTVLVDKVAAYFEEAGGLAGKTIAVWGLAFKPNTDDVREAAALSVIHALLTRGARIRANDPVALESARRLLGDRVHYVLDPYECLKGADALVVATEWHDYRAPDVEKMKLFMRQLVVFDGRNIYARQLSLRQSCRSYIGIGIV